MISLLPLLRAVCIAAVLFNALVSGAIAQAASYVDATGDISSNVSTGGGTLDIVSMEVAETATDLIFTLTVNGNITTTNWGNFMIGIANQKSVGTQTGNGWGRPISMNAGGGNGMTHWIGSWVNNGGGSQLWTYASASWSGPTALKAYSFTAAAQSTIQYTVTKASLGVTKDDTILFDAYSSGGGGTDSAVDALSNPNIAITTWSQTYTSQAPTISSYKISVAPPVTTQNVTFRVDMRVQIQAGLFNPEAPDFDLIEVQPVDNTAFSKIDLEEVPGQPGVYANTVSVTAVQGVNVAYRFNIVSASDLPEDLTRTFAMPAGAETLPLVFFDDIAGYRNVTFRVDMNAQIAADTFDPLTQSVIVAGNFNDFSVDPAANPALKDDEADGIYEVTFLIGGAEGSQLEYKFVTLTGTAASYEFGGANRTAALEFNPDGAFDPQVLPVAIYGIPANARPVTFTVDMSLEVAAGRFDPATDNARVAGSFNDWNTGAEYNLTREGTTSTYSATFLVDGNAGGEIQYKFFNSAPAPNGSYEFPGANRTFTLGPVIAPQVLPPAVFGTTSSQARDITFSVDMSVQVALGLFNPDDTNPESGGIVQVRGIAGNFGSGPQLTRQGTTLIYSGTFPVPGDAGSTLGYKFWSPRINFYNIPDNTGFEQIVLGDKDANRTVTLSASGTPMDLGTVFFSNQLFYLFGSAPGAFATTQGTASAPQSVTINGQGLTAPIFATAPTGYEVSNDGVAYGNTATIAPVSGSVTGSNNLRVRIAASALVGSPAGNVALTSAGSQPVNISVTGTVTASGQTFAGWSGSTNAPTPALQLKYAIGGASSPTATNGVPSVTAISSNALSITAVVRTNDPTLTVSGQSLVNLATGIWTTNEVTVTPRADPAPEGCQVQTFSIPRGTDGRKFLRLRTLLTNP